MTITSIPAPVLRADALERETVREGLSASERAYQRMIARARSVIAGEAIDYRSALLGQREGLRA